MPPTNLNSTVAPADTLPEWVAVVREKVESLRFGIVQLVVHDGRVTQIKRTENTRFPAPRGQAAE